MRESIRNCFVTGDWGKSQNKAGASDSSGSDIEGMGDDGFEDLETGEVFDAMALPWAFKMGHKTAKQQQWQR